MTTSLPRVSVELATYIGLRIAILALTVLLAASVFLENAQLRSMAWSGKLEGFVALGSISAYWYTPAQSVLVAVLVGYGVCLIAIRGETAAEEILLNVSGLFAPVAAFVPTVWIDCPTTAPYPVWCPDRNGFADRVANGVVAVAVTGGLVIATFLVLALVQRRRAEPQAVAGFAVTVAVYAGMLVWFAVDRAGFAHGAHHLAGVLLFGGVLVVAILRTVRTRTPPAPGAPPARGARARVRALVAGGGAPPFSTDRRGPVAALYLVTSVALGLSFVLVVWIVVATRDDVGAPRLFWIEWVLLVFFVVFWLVQTLDFWSRNRPFAA
jgi:hypothetical protein